MYVIPPILSSSHTLTFTGYYKDFLIWWSSDALQAMLKTPLTTLKSNLQARKNFAKDVLKKMRQGISAKYREETRDGVA